MVIATGGGGIGAVADETETLVTRGWERVSPLIVPLMIPNMASCQVSMDYGINGPVVTKMAACAAGVYSLSRRCTFCGAATRQAIVTGGTESSILPLAFISMARTGALSSRNDDPQTASRPFDRERDGFVFGEGAAVLVLETLEHAQRAARASWPSWPAPASPATPTTSPRPSRPARAPRGRCCGRSRTPS